MGSKLIYQTILVSTPAAAAGVSNRGAAAEAGVQLFQQGSQYAQGVALSWRINNEIEKRQAQILQAIEQYERFLNQSRADVGVLIIAASQEMEDFAEGQHKAFLSVTVGEAGLDVKAVVRRYLAMPKIVQAPAKGWVRKEEYVWATRSK